MAVLLGEADTQALAGFELHLARALDVEEEKLHRVAHPGDDRGGKLLAARFDLGAAPVRQDTTAFDAAAQPHVAQLRIDRGEVDDNQIVRHAEDGKPVYLALGTAAAQDR